MDEFDEEPEDLEHPGENQEKVGEIGPKEEIGHREEKVALAMLIPLLLVAGFVLFSFAGLSLAPGEHPGGTASLAGGQENISHTPAEATAYCTEQGYQAELTNGEQSCVFPDGTKCGEQDFLNGRCAHPRNDCTLMPSFLGSGEITAQELARGWYWGTCEQKKQGTPGNWLHMTESSMGMWYMPTNDTGTRCDCFYMEEP